MSFPSRVMDLVNNFQKSYNCAPNELWLGYKEEYEMNCYINEDAYLRQLDKTPEEMQLDRNKIKTEFMGLKVRFAKWADSSSFFKVDYNPHYKL
jgi:hypothetical protein